MSVVPMPSVGLSRIYTGECVKGMRLGVYGPINIGSMAIWLTALIFLHMET